MLRGNEVASLTISRDCHKMPLLWKLLAFSSPSVERLHIHAEKPIEWRDEIQAAHSLWQDLPSLRELSLSRVYILPNQISAPNLVHMALENTRGRQEVSVQSILGLLCGCPLLETLFIVYSGVRPQDLTHSHFPVSLPNLHAIELGPDEVHSGFMVYLQFPQNAAVGFRELPVTDVCGGIPSTVMATVQHVLGKIVIRRITLAIPQHLRGNNFFIRFEGLQGSLEITAGPIGTYTSLFGSGGVLFSHSFGIEKTRELHIIGFGFHDWEWFDHGEGWFYVSAAMPNLVSISFFRCKGPHMFGPLTPTNTLSPPFPYLEHVMVLGPGPGVRGMAKARKDYGVPLKTLVVGRRPKGFVGDLEDYAGVGKVRNDYLEDYAGVGEFVDDLRVGCPTEIVEWGIGNEILNIWSTIGVPGPVSPNQNVMTLA
jgi:hypothetical protein